MFGKREMFGRRRSEWVVLLLPMIVVVTCGWLVAAGRPFSSRLDGQASTAWRFLGPSINLDCELRRRLRCGAAPGPWTPAQLGKLGPAVSFLGEPSSRGASSLALRARRCSVCSTVTTEIFKPVCNAQSWHKVKQLSCGLRSQLQPGLPTWVVQGKATNSHRPSPFPI